MIIGGDACRVLDIGGSLGADYLDVMAKVPKAKDYLSYTIVEGEKLLSHMPADMKTFDNLQFYSSLDGVEGHFDIVHLGSSLQYIDRPFDFLTYLIDTYDPKFLVLSDIPASNIPSFVSHQIFYEKKIPYNFFNLEEFKDFFKNKFDLLYESKFIRDILNQEEIVPCSDLPKDHQIDCTKHFLWRKQ